VIVLSQDLLAAGTDTTSVTLQWAMAELLRNPKLLKHAQDELDTIVGTDRVVEESDLQHLPYLQATSSHVTRVLSSCRLLSAT
jgi:cytochrome P450